MLVSLVIKHQPVEQSFLDVHVLLTEGTTTSKG